MYIKNLLDKVDSLDSHSAIRKNAILKPGLSINNTPYGILLNNNFFSFPFWNKNLTKKFNSNALLCVIQN